MKPCDTCIYGSKTEYFKPCIIYRDDCEYYEEKRGDMTREDKYLLGCLFAVNRLIEKGSSDYGVKVDGKWETISWAEIKEWIEKQYGIEQEVF